MLLAKFRLVAKARWARAHKHCNAAFATRQRICTRPSATTLHAYLAGNHGSRKHLSALLVVSAPGRIKSSQLRYHCPAAKAALWKTIQLPSTLSPCREREFPSTSKALNLMKFKSYPSLPSRHHKRVSHYSWHQLATRRSYRKRNLHCSPPHQIVRSWLRESGEIWYTW